MDDHRVQPPTTVKEMGIHLGYLRDDIQELKTIVKEQGEHYATNVALSALDIRVNSLEKHNDLKNTLLWVGLVASAIINVVVIYQLFTGSN